MTRVVASSIFGMASATHLEILSQDWLGNSDLVLFVVVFVIGW